MWKNIFCIFAYLFCLVSMKHNLSWNSFKKMSIFHMSLKTLFVNSWICTSVTIIHFGISIGMNKLFMLTCATDQITQDWTNLSSWSCFIHTSGWREDWYFVFIAMIYCYASVATAGVTHDPMQCSAVQCSGQHFELLWSSSTGTGTSNDVRTVGTGLICWRFLLSNPGPTYP